MQMNLKDGGKNRKPMRDVGTRGLRSVLMEIGEWHDNMTRVDARAALWKWTKVVKQMSRIEQLCYEHGVVLVYQSKAHPIFNPTEVTSHYYHLIPTYVMCKLQLFNYFSAQWFWRKIKKLLENIFNLAEIRDRYVQLQRDNLSGSGSCAAQFKKWYKRASTFAQYYARGGQGYMRDRNLVDLDFSHLRSTWDAVPTRSFQQLSEYAHELNRVVFRGKQWSEDQQLSHLR